MEYKDYLKSPHWKGLKAVKAKRTKRRCAICAADNNIDCHHLVYRNLHDVKTSDLRWLCRRCHDLAHQLIKDGTIRFKPGASHHSLFAVTKAAVKKSLGISKKNLFWPTE
jgi:hypothetical protein